MYILENTSLHSPLRSLCLDHVGLGILSRQYIFQRGKNESGTEINALPAGYKADLMDAVITALTMQNLEVKDVKLDRQKYPLHHKLRSYASDPAKGVSGNGTMDLLIKTQIEEKLV